MSDAVHISWASPLLVQPANWLEAGRLVVSGLSWPGLAGSSCRVVTILDLVGVIHIMTPNRASITDYHPHEDV